MVIIKGYAFKYKNFHVFVYDKHLELYDKTNSTGKPNIIIETNENYSTWIQEVDNNSCNRQDKYDRIIKIINI
jgi:hypothetical protein